MNVGTNPNIGLIVVLGILVIGLVMMVWAMATAEEDNNDEFGGMV